MDIRQHGTSNYMYMVRLGAHRPRMPLTFVQPCPMGVTPLRRNGGEGKGEGKEAE